MFSRLNDLNVKGGTFCEMRQLRGILQQRINLVFGANGSGKSTISRGFAALAAKTPSDNRPISDILVEGNRPLTDEMREHIHVFNEDFVDKNVRFSRDGLETITMLGEAAFAASEAEKLKRQIDEHRSAYEDKKKELELAQANLKNAIQRQDSSLRDCWAERYMQVHWDRQRRPSIDDRLKSSVEQAVADPAWPQDLAAHFDELLRKLQAGKDGTEVVWTAPALPTDELLQEADRLLAEKVLPAEVDERMREILEREQHYIDQARHRLIDHNAAYCPLCQQDLSRSYRETLLERISRALNEDAGRFKEQLTDCIGLLENGLQAPATADNDYYQAELQAAREAHEALQTCLADICQQLAKKLSEQLYQRVSAGNAPEAIRLKNVYESALEALRSKTEEYNADLKRTKELQAELDRINLRLARQETAQMRADIERYSGEKASLEENLKQKKKLIETAENTYNARTNETKNTTVAKDLINDFLLCVYCDKNRLQLRETQDGRYSICVRGQENIRPELISVGERNVLALAYFFTRLSADQERNSRYSEPMLVVIDDPVSSFDEGSRMGIIALLKRESFRILDANSGSKMLIFSHELQMIADLHDMTVKERSHYCNSEQFWELRRGSLSPIRKYTNQYQRLLNQVSLFGFGDPDDGLLDAESKGNTIRRFLEQYASMMYKSDPYTMLTDPNLLRQITDPELRAFAENIPVRLVLNHESHGQITNSVRDINAEPAYRTEELQKIARSVIRFVYCTNPYHLEKLMHPEGLRKLQQWEDRRRQEI